MRRRARHLNGTRRRIGRYSAVSSAVVVILALSATASAGPGGQASNLRKALFWQAVEVPQAWKPNPDDSTFWLGGGEGATRRGLPQIVWWWVKFMGESLPPEKILSRSEGYEIDHPRLKDYRQALSGVSSQAGPMFVTGPGGHETVLARFLVMEFQTIEGAGIFTGIVAGLFQEAAPGRAQLKQRTLGDFDDHIQRRIKDVGTVQLSPGCEYDCTRIRETPATSYWGWERRPVSLGDEAALFELTSTQVVWEVMSTCRDKRWAKIDSVAKVGDFPNLKEIWGLVRRNNYVLAVFIQAGGGYEGKWDAEPCGGKFVPPKAPPIADVRDLIIRAYERMALGVGMPPNIPKDPFGVEKK